MPRASDFAKFRLVFWKNCVVMIRKPLPLIVTLCIAFGIIIAIVLFRLENKHEIAPHHTYPFLPLDIIPEKMSDFAVHIFAYYPKKYNATMIKVSKGLKLAPPVGFNSEAELIDYVKSDVVGKRAGIVFRTKNSGGRKVLQVSLRFYTQLWWNTEEIWNSDRVYTRHRTLPTGSYHDPGYYTRGFAAVQYAVFSALYGDKLGNTSVLLNRMPVRSSLDDQFYPQMYTYVAFFIRLFLFDLSHAVVTIVAEKEASVKEMMLIMGLPNYVWWLAYLATFTVKMVVFIVVATIVWKSPIYNKPPSFEYTDAGLLFIVLIVFAMALTSFAMLLSNIMSSNTQIEILSFGIGTIMSFPVTASADFREMSPLLNAFVLVLSPSSYGMIILTIIVYESISIGLQWCNLFVSPGGTAFAAGTLIIAMLVQTVIHLVLSIYLENVLPADSGTPRKWYYPIEGIFRRPKRYAYDEIIKERGIKVDCGERPDPSSVPGVIITKLTKKFGKNLYAVNNLNLTLYKNEITILLGENGAGKSTIMAMLAGLMSPTSGHVLYNGKFDLGWDLKPIRQLIGICPQKMVLFDQLTAKEHLIFYGRLKGLSKREASRRADEFLSRCKMTDKQDLRPGRLPVGMQKVLSLGIALTEGVEVVLLDEPTSGVDVASRRLIWNILAEAKKNRTILLATHFMDEADVLGDRVAIVHEGRLKCVGSSNYLKTKFESSYSLTLALKSGADLRKISEFISSFVQSSKLKHQYGAEVTYQLSPKSVSAFGDLFKRLESTGATIGIESFGIELPGLEDVFLKATQDPNKTSGSDKIDTANTAARAPLRGYRLLWSQFVGLLQKRFHYYRRNIVVFLLQLFSLPLYSIYAILTYQGIIMDDPALDLPLDMYTPFGERVCFVEAESNAIEAFVAHYKEVVSSACTVRVVQNLTQHIFGLDNVHNYKFMWSALVGAHFESDRVVAKFNNEPLHTIPLALTAVFNALIRTVDHTAPDLLFVNHPVPYEDKRFKRDRHSIDAILVAAFFSMWVAVFGYKYHVERNSGAMHLQFISGMLPIWYWIWSFLLDLTVILSAFAIASTIFVLFFHLNITEEFLRLIVLFAIATLPLMYILACATKDIGSFLIYLIIVVGSGVLLSRIHQALLVAEMVHTLDNVDYYFLIHPHFNLHNWISLSMMYDGDPDTEVNIAMFVVSSIVMFVALLLYDMQCLNWMANWWSWCWKQPTVELGALNADVQEEMAKVDAMTPEAVAQIPLVARHLQKRYKKRVVVKDCTFALEKSECLGLLGQNGAGKTTVFKMLTGDKRINGPGDAFLQGVSIKHHLLKCYNSFGYCPQHEALLQDLTGMEWLKIICRIRGIRSADISPTIATLVQELGFSDDVHKRLYKMSGGNKRKLSTALALVGDSKVVYLDEPTTGMDPGSKRRVWNVVSQYMEQGTSVILTSHSMDECEALCTRLIIMVDGKMDSIATSYQLKQRYSKTGHMVIQVERRYANDLVVLDNLKKTLAEKVSGLVVMAEYHGKVECQFHVEQPLSSLYTLMQSLKAEHHIDVYGVSNNSSLLAVFLDRVSGNAVQA